MTHRYEEWFHQSASAEHARQQARIDRFEAGTLTDDDLTYFNIQETKDREWSRCEGLIRCVLNEHRLTGWQPDFDDLGALTGYAGRIYGPRIAYTLDRLGALHPDAYPEGISYVFSLAEYPGLSLEPKQWRTLFTKAGFTIDGVPAERPAEPITLWRGSRPRSSGACPGPRTGSGPSTS